jgi:hypothetical protein
MVDPDFEGHGDRLAELIERSKTVFERSRQVIEESRRIRAAAIAARLGTRTQGDTAEGGENPGLA